LKYLLDTNVCIKLLNNSDRLVVKRFSEEIPEDINLCTVVNFEMFYGAFRSQKMDFNIGKLERFIEQFRVFDFNRESAKVCGQIRAELNKKGTPIGVYDLQIAAIAIANDLTLVTHNVREFGRVDDLRYEDWEVDVSAKNSFGA
jgi:tRNA(fMet)-specific endonuclease VapC